MLAGRFQKLNNLNVSFLRTWRDKTGITNNFMNKSFFKKTVFAGNRAENQVLLYQ